MNEGRNENARRKLLQGNKFMFKFNLSEQKRIARAEENFLFTSVGGVQIED
jgi:hypothetical protein